MQEPSLLLKLSNEIDGANNTLNDNKSNDLHFYIICNSAFHKLFQINLILEWSICSEIDQVFKDWIMPPFSL